MSDYIITCDDETASWIGNDVESMQKIVRCKDCKYYMPTIYTPFSNEALCYGLRTEEDCGMTIVNPDGYCAWGIRKDVNNASN